MNRHSVIDVFDGLVGERRRVAERDVAERDEARADDPAVADDHDALARVLVRDPAQPRAGADVELGPALRARGPAPERIAESPTTGKRSRNSSQVSPSASPAWISHQSHSCSGVASAERGGEDLGRLDRPGEDARVDGVDLAELAGRDQPIAQRRRLRPTQVREALARVMAGEEPLDLGDGLAVADEDEAGLG